MFNTSIYQTRRAGLKSKINSGILLFLGNDESPMNYADNTYRYRQDSTFLYYFGINSPGLAAVIDLDNDSTILFGDEMDIDALVWMGRLATLKEKAESAGVDTTRPSAQLPDFLAEANKKGRTIHFLPPYRAENKIKLLNWLDINPAQVKASSSKEFIKAVVSQRSVKSAEEIMEIEKAVNISVDMHLLAMQSAKPGMNEAEIAALINRVALQHGGDIAYPIILTKNGHILHNHSKVNVINEGDLVLNDSGAETAMGYCGDLTRTFPAGKKFTSIQKQMYEIVLNALNTATAALKPGVRYLDIHNTSCRALTDGLKGLGLMKGDTDEAVAAGAHAMFFQCGTGHMMGLDVHDMEDLGEEYVGYNDVLKKNTDVFGLKSLRLGKELQEGYVLTVEPGIYINPFLIDMWKAEGRHTNFINYDELEHYRNFTGIRIEDNLLITADGSQLLGKPLAKTVAEVEAIRETAF